MPANHMKRGARVTPCTFEPCGRSRKSPTGLCEGHARQLKKGHPLTPIGTYAANALNLLPCTFPTCERLQACHGLCRGHGQQRAHGKTLTPLRAWGQPKQPRAPRTPRPPRVARIKSAPAAKAPRVVSILPAGWERTAPQPRSRSNDRTSMRLEIGPVHPLDDAMIEAAVRTCRHMDGLDQLAALGLVAA